MRKTIQYAVDLETGFSVSRFMNEVAFPVLQFDLMTPANDYQQNYKLEKAPVIELSNWLNGLKWTRKIPKVVKNMHRTFWGLKSLK